MKKIISVALFFPLALPVASTCQTTWVAPQTTLAGIATTSVTVEFREGRCAREAVPNVYQAAGWPQGCGFAEFRLRRKCRDVCSGFFEGGVLVGMHCQVVVRVDAVCGHVMFLGAIRFVPAHHDSSLFRVGPASRS
jgi:hypothetical protein